MSYDSGAPWRNADECPNCGDRGTITGKGGWLLDCRGCGMTFTPDLHPAWSKILKDALNERSRVVRRETFLEASRILTDAERLKRNRGRHMQAAALKEEADLLRLLAEK